MLDTFAHPLTASGSSACTIQSSHPKARLNAAK
jgi:hypothetical protein